MTSRYVVSAAKLAYNDWYNHINAKIYVFKKPKYAFKVKLQNFKKLQDFCLSASQPACLPACLPVVRPSCTMAKTPQSMFNRRLMNLKILPLHNAPSFYLPFFFDINCSKARNSQTRCHKLLDEVLINCDVKPNKLYNNQDSW